MSKAEVENLSDENLKAEWSMIKQAYQMGLPKHLSNHQSLILFANFVNVSNEMAKRKIKSY